METQATAEGEGNLHKMVNKRARSKEVMARTQAREEKIEGDQAATLNSHKEPLYTHSLLRNCHDERQVGRSTWEKTYERIDMWRSALHMGKFESPDPALQPQNACSRNGSRALGRPS